MRILQRWPVAVIYVFILKALMAPALIGFASWAGRRWGPTVGGWFAALPLTSGPVALVLAYEQGPEFTSRACAGILLALVSLAVFALTYSWSAHRVHWAWSSVIGCVAFLVCTGIMQWLVVPLSSAYLIACGALFAASRAIPVRFVTRRSALPAWEIALRMLLGAVLVVALTPAANQLGPHLSGLVTPFPVAATILAASTHCFEGPVAASQLLRGLLIGLLSFALFFLVVGTLITGWGIGAAFLTASLAALAFHAVVWRRLGGGALVAERPADAAGAAA